MSAAALLQCRRYVISQNRECDLPLLRQLDFVSLIRHRSPAKPIRRAYCSNLM